MKQIFIPMSKSVDKIACRNISLLVDPSNDRELVGRATDAFQMSFHSEKPDNIFGMKLNVKAEQSSRSFWKLLYGKRKR